MVGWKKTGRIIPLKNRIFEIEFCKTQNTVKWKFFCCFDIPFPGFTGGSVVNWSIVNYLISKGHKLTVFSDNPRYGSNEIDKNILKKMYPKNKSINCEFVSLVN